MNRVDPRRVKRELRKAGLWGHKQQVAQRLLDAAGTPIEPKREIPFIQWLPDGNSTGRSIDRGPAIYAMAATFIAKGGRYAFVAGDGKAELVAGFPMDDGEKGEMTVVAVEALQNAEGPQVLVALDRLVVASVANMDKFTVVEAAQ